MIFKTQKLNEQRKINNKKQYNDILKIPGMKSCEDVIDLIEDPEDFLTVEPGETTWLTDSYPTYQEDPELYTNWLHKYTYNIKSDNKDFILYKLHISDGKFKDLYETNKLNLLNIIKQQAKKDMFILWLFYSSPVFYGTDKAFPRNVIQGLRDNNSELIDIFKNYFYKVVFKTINLNDVYQGLEIATDNLYNELIKYDWQRRFNKAIKLSLTDFED